MSLFMVTYQMPTILFDKLKTMSLKKQAVTNVVTSCRLGGCRWMESQNSGVIRNGSICLYMEFRKIIPCLRTEVDSWA